LLFSPYTYADTPWDITEDFMKKGKYTKPQRSQRGAAATKIQTSDTRPQASDRKANHSYSCPFGDTENHEKLLSPVKRSLGERLFGAEDTES
jgi:hypothetical protein